MEENFYKDDFENFLQEQANNHKMFPSDNVWRNIQNKLHDDEKWPALTIVAITFLAAIITVSVYFSPKQNIFSIKPPAAVNQNNSAPTPLISALSNTKDPLLKQWNFNEKALEKEPEAETKNVLQPEANVVDVRKKSISIENILPGTIAFNSPISILNTPIAVEKTEGFNTVIDNTTATIPAKNSLSLTTSLTSLTKEAIEQKATNTPVELAEEKKLSLKPNKKERKSKFSYLVYITPSKSFRRLKEDASMQSDNTNGPLALNYVADVNKVVRHTPGNGVEAGVSFGYNLTNNLKLTSGLQLNIRQYWMEAYVTHSELALIALQTVRGVQTVNKFSPYRTTTSGYAATQLANRYYQAALPIGIHYKIVGNKSISLNVAGSVQPTYLLNSNSYLISSDFKNYAESEGMIRKWNVNTSVETFLSIKSGSFSWQVGPQFRYQQKPTFIKEYPIKENLMDYGIKMGVSKSIK